MSTCKYAFAPYVVECSYEGDCIHQRGGGSLGSHCAADGMAAGPISPNTCQFCNAPVFTDARAVGSVRQADGSLKHYHFDCLYAAYPDETDYQSLVLDLFSPNPAAAKRQLSEFYNKERE